MIHPQLKIPETDLNQLCHQYHVDRMYLFGSVVRSDFNKNSDVDMLVEFEQDHLPTLFQIVHLKNSLKLMFNRDVDIISSNNLRNPYFAASIEQGKQLIYGD